MRMLREIEKESEEGEEEIEDDEVGMNDGELAIAKHGGNIQQGGGKEGSDSGGAT